MSVAAIFFGIKSKFRFATICLAMVAAVACSETKLAGDNKKGSAAPHPAAIAPTVPGNAVAATPTTPPPDPATAESKGIIKGPEVSTAVGVYTNVRWGLMRIEIVGANIYGVYRYDAINGALKGTINRDTGFTSVAWCEEALTGTAEFYFKRGVSGLEQTVKIEGRWKHDGKSNWFDDWDLTKTTSTDPVIDQLNKRLEAKDSPNFMCGDE